jgi:uncharacterized membrane protein
MKRMLVVVVDNADKAYEGASALERLSEESTIGLHDAVVVTKNSDDGTITVVRTYESDPEGTMGGTAVGSMIGLLGGPVGLAVGAATGFVIGAAADVMGARVGRDFVRNVTDALAPGKTALVAQIDEDETDPVDARMQPLGGTIFRRELSDVADSEYAHEAASITAKIAEKKAKLAASRARLKGRLTH